MAGWGGLTSFLGYGLGVQQLSTSKHLPAYSFACLGCVANGALEMPVSALLQLKLFPE
jgi:hypothetical protein